MTDTIQCIAIDDEPLALDIIEKFCQRIGNIELEKYSDPTVGLEAICRQRPDIVFLDIEMDGISGLEIAGRLPRVRALFSQPHIYATHSKALTSTPSTICTSHLPIAVSRLPFQKLCDA